MQQKFSIIKDKENKKLIIKEFSELDKDLYSLVCEESYDLKEIKRATKNGPNDLIRFLRTKNIYPISHCASKMADEITNLIGSAKAETVDVLFNDLEPITKEGKIAELQKKPDSDTVKIDELLEDDIDYEESTEQEEIKSISSSASTIKVAEDDSLDVEPED